jgi:hypothetical protein
MLNSYDLVVSALRFIRFDVSKAHRYAMLVDAFDGVADVDNHVIQCVLSLAYDARDAGDDIRDFRGTCEFIHRMAC